MTKKKKLKQAVRARARESGIAYTTARRVLATSGMQSGASASDITPGIEPDEETIKRRVDAAMTFPLTRVVDRYCREHGVDAETAGIHERELRRFLCVASLHPRLSFPMVGVIDPLWHTFIIFTKLYEDYCHKLSRPFIHHEPFDDAQDPSKLGGAYQRFLNRYRQVFGEPPAEIWPANLGNGSDCADCDQQCQGQCAGSD